MSKSADSPDYITTNVSNRGKLVDLNGYLVPETVDTWMAGGGDVDGRKWPDMKFKFAIRDGAAVCIGFSVVSKPGDRPIRNSLLRSFDLDEFAKTAFEEHAIEVVSRDEEKWALPNDPEVSKRVRPLVEAGYANPIAELRHVARIYCDPEFRKTPAHNVWVILNYGSQETANRRIREARKQNLIPPVGASDEELDRQFKVLTQEMDN